MKIAFGIAVVVVLFLVLGASYEFSPVPTWWVDYRVDGLGAGNIEATNGFEYRKERSSSEIVP